MPPILELSDDKKIVIDGMHRLYLHLVINKKSSAICLLIKTKINLPSIPVPFNEVKITPYKIARHISFENYNPDNFRNIKILDELSKG